MAIITEKFNINTRGFTDIIDITNKIQDLINVANVKNANTCIYVTGSTASITTIEFEPGLLKDLPEALERIAPVNYEYKHDQRWKDGNGYAHIRAAIVGTSINVPVVDGNLALGTWQQVVLLDFDNKPRTRTIMIQIIY